MTEQAKHTAGPWEYQRQSPGGYGGGLCSWEVVEADERYVVAAVVTDIEELLNDGEANARLIAAAPDLLAAARGIEHASAALIVKAIRSPEDGDGMEAWTKAMADLRIAIAKADVRS